MNWQIRIYNSNKSPAGNDRNRGVITRTPAHTHTHTHTRLAAPFPGQPGSAGTRKVKPIWILLTQETVSGSGISWAICKSASRSRQITMPAPHHSIFYTPDALPATQPTASKHWRHMFKEYRTRKINWWHRASTNPANSHAQNPPRFVQLFW